MEHGSRQHRSLASPVWGDLQEAWAMSEQTYSQPLPQPKHTNGDLASGGPCTELKALRDENRRLKHLVADLSLRTGIVHDPATEALRKKCREPGA